MRTAQTAIASSVTKMMSTIKRYLFHGKHRKGAEHSVIHDGVTTRDYSALLITLRRCPRDKSWANSAGRALGT